MVVKFQKKDCLIAVYDVLIYRIFLRGNQDYENQPIGTIYNYLIPLLKKKVDKMSNI
jgi:hypothetical protein